MNIDDLDTETLRCIFLAEEMPDSDEAEALRARATRLNCLAKVIYRPGPIIMGYQPAAPYAGVSEKEHGAAKNRTARK
ncbi:hypothetical protein [Sphingomonas endolithica]|uniref:hypothetical protein n=1 Tax=Sphingomonas endolithica TaxID=2972485 RepID=UPI0021B04CAD|nr:hypothetical protein [Sphingomonas sp. ZFBP2030]